MGGEQYPLIEALRGPIGSSPHGRGTAKRKTNGTRAGRFIPAWAGNSLPTMRPTLRPSVHPRMGGEQAHVEAT